MSGACGCIHCRAKTGVPEPVAEAPASIVLGEPPDKPALFRIHYPDGHARDYTLHPDGRLTMTAGGQQWVSALSFDEMAAMSWGGARIEWDPAPLPEPETARDRESAAAPDQRALFTEAS
ncbi:hypothetical protein [Streptomyces chrestomyceticus]|uniref:hypothetical protein n=1 Tax=Streptomyces chrestomyceticus TaxID=68185 RepID=UPI0033EF3248